MDKKTDKFVYLVGGFLRDRLLNRLTNDVDIVVPENACKFSRKIARKLNARVVVLDEKNKIYRVVTKQKNSVLYLDFSQLRGKNILKDLACRDFTINAIASKTKICKKPSLNFQITNLIDPFEGKKDLKKKLIRKVSNKIFKDDPLRLIRAYRFRAELGFKIEPQTIQLIKKSAKLIAKPAKERIRDELMKIFSTDNSAEIISELDKQGLLSPIIPEINSMKRSARKFYFHPQGLWQHSKESLYCLEKIFSEKTYPYGHRYPISGWRLALLKFTTLFHDLSKPETVKKIDGRTRFFGHETEGAKKIKIIMSRLRMSNKQIQIAQKLIKNHMRPGNLFQSEKLTQRAIYRFFRDLGDESIDLLLLSLADRYSYLVHKDIIAYKKFTQKMIAHYFREKEKNPEPKLIDGNIIMKEFGLSPGPLIGKLLRLIEENVSLGKIRTKQQALNLIKKHLHFFNILLTNHKKSL